MVLIMWTLISISSSLVLCWCSHIHAAGADTLARQRPGRSAADAGVARSSGRGGEDAVLAAGPQTAVSHHLRGDGPHGAPLPAHNGAGGGAARCDAGGCWRRDVYPGSLDLRSRVAQPLPSMVWVS